MRTFTSGIFTTQDLTIGTATETISQGTNVNKEQLQKAFAGDSQIGIIGWGSQGPAQAQDIRDSLKGSSIRVVVGLRKDSASWEKARAAGFSEEDGTLGEMYSVISTSDFVILLIEDSAQAEVYRKVFDKMKDGATIGLSHGFLGGYLDSIGESFPKNISVIAVCPKGMGPSVRQLYLQKSGINCSIAVEQDIHKGKSIEKALGWANLLHAPTIFGTSLKMEYISDLTGERGSLVGGPYGLTESLYRYFRETHKQSSRHAFLSVVENITGPISRVISTKGLRGLYEEVVKNGGSLEFQVAYHSAYREFHALISEIYDEVVSGNEIRALVVD